MIKNEDDLKTLYSDLLSLVFDLINGVNLPLTHFYVYELSLNNNSFFVETSEEQVLTIGINSINSIQTVDSRITSEYKRWVRMMFLKSNKISGQSKKFKIMLLNEMKQQVINSATKRLSSKMMEGLGNKSA